ncbi:cysteine dioxygenase family protein [Methylibium sp.]|uniref:cysteine dioxygenase family protein n=1 Tax=Methylibium sp. TaxID=2067992 RepID=UPI0025F9A61D|nr:cysteine dioxygenase family protein [Methylibium sp.]
MDAGVTAALREAGGDTALLSAEQRRGRADRYVRHLLYADPAGRFSVVSLVWGPGQFSPVHGHYTWCGYVVVSGQLHEESYVWVPDRKVAIQAEATDRGAGGICFSHAGLEEIHRLGNRGDDWAVSVHVYGVDGTRVSSHVNRVVTV